VSKGAPQVVLSFISQEDAIKDIIDKQIDNFATGGYRTIGVAKTNGQGEWELLLF